MAAIAIVGDAVVVTPTPSERFFGLKGRVEIPVSAVRVAETVGNPIRATRGGRVGLHLPVVAKVGTWGLGFGVRQLVFAYRGRPGVRLVLDRGRTRYDEVIVSTDDADSLVAALRRRDGRAS